MSDECYLSKPDFSDTSNPKVHFDGSFAQFLTNILIWTANQLTCLSGEISISVRRQIFDVIFSVDHPISGDIFDVRKKWVPPLF